MTTTATDQKPAGAAKSDLAWCCCGRTIYWCTCTRPRPQAEQRHQVPCDDAFCDTCWEAGER